MSLSAMFTSIKVTKVTKKLTHINNSIHSYMFFFFFSWMTQLRKRGALGFINEGKKWNRFKEKKKKRRRRNKGAVWLGRGFQNEERERERMEQV